MLVQLYWAMRLGMAFIWLWTAVVSWMFYPQTESVAWLRRLGLGQWAYAAFVGACVLDLVFGIVSAVYSRRWVWQTQFGIVVLYSLAIVMGLPEFLFHPFGPITKNLAVLACLAWLAILEKR